MTYAEELQLIKECLDWLSDNNIEQECLEYETGAIHKILERLYIVMQPYYEDEVQLEQTEI